MIRLLNSGTLVLMLLVSGCSTLAGDSSQKQGQPSTDQSAPQTGDSTTFYEKSKFLPATRQIAGNASQPDVDYQSELSFRFDPTKLEAHVAKLADARGNLFPPMSDADKKKLESLQILLGKLNDFVTVRAASIRESVAIEAEARTTTQPTASAQARLEDLTRRYQDLVNARDKTDTALRHAVRDYLKDISPPGTDAKVLRGQLDAIVGATPDSVAGEIQYISAQIESIVSRVRADALKAAESKIVLRVQTVVKEPGHSGEQLHTDGYDTNADKNVEQDERIATRLTKSDIAYLKPQLDAVSNDADQIRKFKDESNSARAAAMKAALQSAQTSLIQLQTDVASLAEKITAAKDKASVAGQKAILEDAAAFFGTNLKTDLDTLIADTKLPAVGANANPADVILSAASQLSSLKDDVSNIAADVQKAATTANSLTGIGQQIRAAATTDPTVKTLADTLEQDVPNLSANIGALLKPDGVIAALEKILGINDLQSVADMPVPDLGVDPSLTNASVTNPPEGTISLKSNVPRGGVDLNVHGGLYATDDKGKVQAGEEPVVNETFAVKEYGLNSRWSADLVFIDRLGQPRLKLGERVVHFDPAPALSWTLHYEPVPGDGLYGSKIWDALYPGVGLNIVGTNFNQDSGVQVGIGGHVSLFHDLLMAGYGCNLNARRNQGYFYIGISAFQAFDDAKDFLHVGH